MTKHGKKTDNLAFLPEIRNTESMAQEYEVVRYPKLRHIHIFVDEITYRSQHLHGDYEIGFCLDGSASFVGLHEVIVLRKGEAIFVDSNQVHSIASGDVPMIGLFFQISNRFLQDYLPELHGKSYPNVNLREVLGEEKMRDCWEKACRIGIDFFAESPHYRIQALQFALTFLNDLFQTLPHQDLSLREYENRKKTAGRLKRIVNYLDTHHREKLRLEEVAEKYGLKVLGRIPLDGKLAALCDKGALELMENDYLDEAQKAIEEALRI